MWNLNPGRGNHPTVKPIIVYIEGNWICLKLEENKRMLPFKTKIRLDGLSRIFGIRDTCCDIIPRYDHYQIGIPRCKYHVYSEPLRSSSPNETLREMHTACSVFHTIKYMLQGAGKLRGDGKLKYGGKFNPAIPQLPPAFCLDIQTGIFRGKLNSQPNLTSQCRGPTDGLRMGGGGFPPTPPHDAEGQLCP